MQGVGERREEHVCVCEREREKGREEEEEVEKEKRREERGSPFIFRLPGFLLLSL